MEFEFAACLAKPLDSRTLAQQVISVAARTWEKHPAITILIADDLALNRQLLPISAFSTVVKLGPWLLSHAGLAEKHIGSLDLATIDELVETAWANAQKGEKSWIFDRGACRRGTAMVGGIFWLDWAREFRPVVGLNQIVGHSPARGVARGKWVTRSGIHRSYEYVEPCSFPRMEKLPQPGGDLASVNWCLDTAQVIAGIIDRGVFEFVT